MALVHLMDRSPICTINLPKAGIQTLFVPSLSFVFVYPEHSM